ncbi:hypothetical protein Taro_051486, partial [Colocasia esculenta]|nr:hypothetical protein [Colocasia esculenta]
ERLLKFSSRQHVSIARRWLSTDRGFQNWVCWSRTVPVDNNGLAVDSYCCPSSSQFCESEVCRQTGLEHPREEETAPTWSFFPAAFCFNLCRQPFLWSTKDASETPDAFQS